MRRWRVRCSLAVAALVTGACAADPSPPVPSEDGDRPVGDEAAEVDDEAVPLDDEDAPAVTRPEPSSGWHTVDADGVEREVFVHVPETLTPGLDPVVAFHGRDADVDHLLAISDLEAAADRHGFVVIAPQAIDRAWTVTGELADDPDDVALFDAVLALDAELRGATSTVALVGFSQGGSLAMRLAAERPDRVSGLVTVAAQLPTPELAVRPTAPVPALFVYGTADPLRPYEGLAADELPDVPDPPTPSVSAVETAEAFADAAGAELVPAEVEGADGDAALRISEAAGGAAPVFLVTVEGGGHTWPGTAERYAVDRVGPTSDAFDATATAIEFLRTGRLLAGPGTSR